MNELVNDEILSTVDGSIPRKNGLAQSRGWKVISQEIRWNSSSGQVNTNFMLLFGELAFSSCSLDPPLIIKILR